MDDHFNSLKNLDSQKKEMILWVVFIVFAVLVLGALGYAAYNLLSWSIEIPFVQWSISKSSPTADWKTYRNEAFGFEVKYPQIGNIDEDSYLDQLNVNFGNISNDKAVKISVVPQQMEGVMREAVSIQSETEIIVDKVKGSRITGIDQKGLPVNEIWVGYNNRVYLIKGEGEIFSQVLSTFKFIP